MAFLLDIDNAGTSIITGLASSHIEKNKRQEATMKTIRQIADEIGVSKQAVHQKIKRQPLARLISTHLSTIDNVIHVDDDGADMIQMAFRRVNCQPLTPQNVDVNTPSTLTVITDQQTTISDQQQTITDQQKTIQEQAEAIRELCAELAAQKKPAGDDEPVFSIPDLPPRYIDRLIAAFRLITPQRKGAYKK